MSNKFVVIDLETTGNNPKKDDRIIQFAAVVIENGKIVDQFSSLINPERSIPAFIEELTGINDEMVKDAPLFNDIKEKVMELLNGAYFVAHNVLFDLSFLQEELIQSGMEGFFGSVLDTVEMARVLYPTADGYKLSDLAERENLSHDRPHQADSDALVTAELFLLFMERLERLPFVTLKQLLQLSGGLKSDLQLLLDDMVLSRSETKEERSSEIEIFQGLAIKKRIVEQEDKPRITYTYPEKEEDKKALLQQGFPFFEARTGQFKMMDTIYQCFLNQQHALIEAGTGVGKSLGYLLPCAFYSNNHQVPIVISTHTIQLQEQLLNKEIPLLAKMLSFTVNAVLLKGRHHYISLYKFYHSLAEEDDNYDTTLSKMQILVWLTETETGDKDELNLSSGGLLYWNKIRSERAGNLKNKDWDEKDFYLTAKRKAQNSDFIITNHSLLLSDLKSEGKLLPDYKFAIIDEGHHLEKAASQFFGMTLDYLSTRQLLGQFGQCDQKQLFYFLEGLLSDINGTKNHLISTFELNQLVLDAFYEMDEFFRLMSLFVKAELQAVKPSFNRVKIRFSAKQAGKEKQALVHSAERFSFLLRDLHCAIIERLDWIQTFKSSFSNEEVIKFDALKMLAKGLEELREAVRDCFIKESSDVKWIEVDLRSPQNVTTFMAQPASVASSLKRLFFQTKKSVVLTSATLTVNGSFRYMLKEVGLDPNITEQKSIPSPFHYDQQVQLFLPEDLPAVNQVSMEEYVIAITEHIITLAEATKGRMLILFTSYDMLKKTFELIKESGFLEEYALIAQGITSGSRSRLTRNFQRYDKAILLGTSSFWEGIDIPGEDLTCLIIVRLPFSPPDEPITEAKCQLIEQQGGNPFSDYSLPEAVLRFKQGFGRLIRTEKDKGIMVVFDKRIVTTKYGKEFLRSIPPITIKKGNISTIVQQINQWLS